MIKEKQSRSRKVKEDWFKVGLKTLAEQSETHLTIDYLCTKMQVTKGSFYHHFNNRNHYVEQLLQHWSQKYTQEIIIPVENKAKTVEQQAHLLIEGALRIPSDLEIAIRSWAMRDSLVQKFQEEVDKLRLDFLARILAAIVGEDRTHTIARLLYSCHIGCQQMLPRVTKQQYMDILNQTLCFLNIPLYREKIS